MGRGRQVRTAMVMATGWGDDDETTGSNANDSVEYSQHTVDASS